MLVRLPFGIASRQGFAQQSRDGVLVVKLVVLEAFVVTSEGHHGLDLLATRKHGDRHADNDEHSSSRPKPAATMIHTHHPHTASLA